MVHPHAVDSQLGQVRGDFLGVLVRGEIGAEAEVHTPDPQPTRANEKMAVLDMCEAIGPRRPGGKPREVGRRLGSILTRHDEREPIGG